MGKPLALESADCPCCGREFEGEHIPPHWLPYAVFGATSQLVLKALLRDVGRWFQAEELAEVVYGANQLKDQCQSVRVVIHTMRPLVERVGWMIEGRNQVGYRLIPRVK